MKEFFKTFSAYFVASFVVVLCASLVVNFSPGFTFYDLLPGLIVILFAAAIASAISAALTKSRSWPAVLVPQLLTLGIMWVVYRLIA